jgi:hypothetical protein
MAPELSRDEERTLRALAGRLDTMTTHGVLLQLIQKGSNSVTFLAEILLRTIQALEREDGYQQEQRERAG